MAPPESTLLQPDPLIVQKNVEAALAEDIGDGDLTVVGSAVCRTADHLS